MSRLQHFWKPVVIGALLWLILSSTAPARAANHPVTNAQKSDISPTLKQLQQQLDRESAAEHTGDPAQVAQAAQSLVALALRAIAEVRAQEGLWPQAVALYRASLAIEDSPETNAELATALAHAKSGNGSSDTTTEPDARMLLSAHAPPTRARELQKHSQELRQVLAGGFNDWGTAEARQQLFAQALLHFHQAEQWDAATPGLMRNIGNSAFQLGNYTESARAFELAVLADPQDQQSRLLLGMSQFSLGSYAEAVKSFAPVEALAMRDPRASSAWAYSLAETKQQLHANQIADVLIAENLEPQELMLVCQIYNVTEDYKQAADCFSTVARRDPSIPHTHFLVGSALLHLDRPNDAIPELREELKIAPGSPDAQYYLAYALLETSHRDEAEALLRQVVSEAPAHAQAQYQLGKAMLEDGDATGAITHLEAAARLDPEADYIHYQLQTAYRRAGRTEDANRELAVYLDLKAKHRAPAPQAP